MLFAILVVLGAFSIGAFAFSKKIRIVTLKKINKNKIYYIKKKYIVLICFFFMFV